MGELVGYTTAAETDYCQGCIFDDGDDECGHPDRRSGCRPLLCAISPVIFVIGAARTDNE